MPTTTIHGFDMYYEKVGSGPAIAFIHGGYGGAASSVLPRDESWVSNFTDTYSVVTYDRRSAGRSAYLDGAYTLDALASDLDELLQHLGISQAFIVGSSGGGPIALTYALAYPEKIVGLVLPNTSARLWTHEARLNLAEVVRNRINFLEAHGPEATFDTIQKEQDGPTPLVLAPGGSGPRPPEHAQALEERNRKVQELLSNLSRADRVRYAIGELRNQAAYLDSDLRERLGEINMPTLVVHGDGDLQVPYDLGVELANGIAGAKLVTVPGAGHGVMQWSMAVEAIWAFCDRIYSQG
jgi:pimeloyl-ACP methyl ester carboxylesterase